MLLETTSFDATISVCNTYELPCTIKLPNTVRFPPTLEFPVTAKLVTPAAKYAAVLVLAVLAE